LSFIDDNTHFTVVYLLKSKSEVSQCFKKYEAMATAHFVLKISSFRCVNGGEYILSELKEMFEEKGIQFEFTIRYTPQQNGVAERMNRTIVDKARCMLLESGLKKSFWIESVLTAVYLINQSPTAALEKSIPAELWYGQKQNLQKLRVFGSLVNLHIPNEITKGKIYTRTKKCIMLGYCPNGY
jgi:hypothetical protein